MPIDSIIFGLGHRARHGKDSVAAAIIKHRKDQYDVRRYSFASELKREINENAMKSGGMIRLFDDGLRCDGCGYWQTNGNVIALPDWVQYDFDAPMDDPECPYGKQRTLLQWWGTEFRRNCEPDYWIKKLAKRIEEEKPEVALITDMRFPNEAAWVREYGDTIKVHRTGFTPLTTPHVSEQALAHLEDHEWGAVIYNDRGLEELEQLALYTFDELMEKPR